MHAHTIVPTAKTKGREHSVVVIGFANGANLANGSNILIVWPDSMEGLWGGNVTV